MHRITRRHGLGECRWSAPFVRGTPRAAAYPDRPILVISPYAAGGVGENIMHLLAVSMEPRLGQKLIIEASPARRAISAPRRSRAPRPMAAHAADRRDQQFRHQSVRDEDDVRSLATLAPIAKAAEVPLVLFSNPAVPARTLPEFIAYAKANPGKVNYGVPSLGTVNHLMMERLKQTTGTQITCIPYRGSPPAVLALLKNEIQVFPIGLAAVGTSFARRQAHGFAVATRGAHADAARRPDHRRVRFPWLRRIELVRSWPRRPARRSDILDSIRLRRSLRRKAQLRCRERFTSFGYAGAEAVAHTVRGKPQAEAEFWRETVRRGKNSIE